MKILSTASALKVMATIECDPMSTSAIMRMNNLCRTMTVTNHDRVEP